MNKIFRGTLEAKTEVLDQDAISDSRDPLKEVARHVSTPSLAWTKSTGRISHYQPLPQLKTHQAGPNHPSPSEWHLC